MTDDEIRAENKRIEENFERAYDEHGLFGPMNDDEFMKLALHVFCAHAFVDGPMPQVAQKASRAIATRFMQPPNDVKNWRVTFPAVGWQKKTMLTPRQKKSRSIAFDVCQLILAGEKMTHAAAQVAAKRKVSTQKVNGDYYEYRRDFVAAYKLANPDDANVSKLEE